MPSLAISDDNAYFKTAQSRYPCECVRSAIRPRGYKTFFMLNSAEHEIYFAYILKYWQFFKTSFMLNSAEHAQLFWAWKKLFNCCYFYFFLTKGNFMLSWVELEKKFYNLGAWIQAARVAQIDWEIPTTTQRTRVLYTTSHQHRCNVIRRFCSNVCSFILY